MLVGGFTLLAAILTQIISALLEGRKQRREDARRWDSERRRIYAEFIQNMDNGMSVVHKNWTNSEVAWKDITDAVRKAKVHKYELDLIASKPVRNEVQALWFTIAEGVEKNRGGDKSRQGQKEFLESYRRQEKG